MRVTWRVKAAFGANYDRLAAVKKKDDPTNLRRTRQSPTGLSGLLPIVASPSGGDAKRLCAAAGHVGFRGRLGGPGGTSLDLTVNAGK